jgi:hypothetical protein
MKVRFEQLKKVFEIEWKRIPDYSTIRNIILEVNEEELEEQLRCYSKECTKTVE